MTKKNLFIIFCVLVFMITVPYLTISAYEVLSGSYEDVRDILHRQRQVQQNLTGMYRSVKHQTMALLQASGSSTAGDNGDVRKRIQENTRQVLRLREQYTYAGLFEDAAWSRFDRQLSELLAQTTRMDRRLDALLLNGNDDGARAFIMDEMLPVQIQMLDVLTQMNVFAGKQLSRMIESLNSEFVLARRKFQIVGGMLLSLVLMFFGVIVFRLSRGEDDLKGLLAHRETQYKIIVDTVKDGIIAMNATGRISSFNREAEKIFGYRAEDIIGQSIFQLIDAQDHKRLEDYIHDINNKAILPAMELTGRRSDYNRVLLHMSLSDTGMPGEQCLSGIIRDITLEKANYNVLLRYREVFSRSDDALAFIDTHHIYKMANEKYLKLFNRKAEDVIDLTVAEVIGEKLFYTFEKYQQQCVQNDEVVSLSRWVETPSGKLYLSINYTPYHADTGEVVGIAIAIRDITEQKRAEDEYFRSSKLESVGVLAGGIAHDFNNLLGSIIGNIEMAERSLDEKPRAEKFLHTAANASKRAADLTQQLLTFSKGGEPVKEHIDVCTLLRDTLDFSMHGSSIPTHLDCPDDIWGIYADAGQISQVIQNIVINAKQAMPDGGAIKVWCENIPRHSEEARQCRHRHADFVKIRICDYGTGMTQEVMDSIFDPYFTTREEGSGLGLALSYSIITKHDGLIKVDSQLGQGSCFTLYLPASQKPRIVDTEAVSDMKNEGNDVTVLVMDDDEMIREIAQAMLEEMHYGVIHAGDGEAALRLYRESLEAGGKAIDIVIMDLTIMGGMGGKEAVKAILAIDPDAKVIVSSGYSNDPVMANYQQYGFVGAVSKPYNMDELASTIQQCLSSS